VREAADRPFVAAWTLVGPGGYFAIVIQRTKRTTRIITPRRMNWMLP
jgi:hypothetical protein